MRRIKIMTYVKPAMVRLCAIIMAKFRPNGHELYGTLCLSVIDLKWHILAVISEPFQGQQLCAIWDTVPLFHSMEF